MFEAHGGGAVRTLNKVAMAHPLAVTPCNMDMEGLINDGNRSIATLVRRRPPPPASPPPSPALFPPQVIYHFISGFTSKMAGTEEGVTKPVAAFSSCYGEPFLVWHPVKYATMLAEKLEQLRPERIVELEEVVSALNGPSLMMIMVAGAVVIGIVGAMNVGRGKAASPAIDALMQRAATRAAKHALRAVWARMAKLVMLIQQHLCSLDVALRRDHQH